MDRSLLLAHLRKTRFSPGDRNAALVDARRIAAYLRREFDAEVWGVGSLFEGIRPFLKQSDIDLVAHGIPPGRYIAAYARASDMTRWKLDLIPLETANDLLREIVESKGVRL